MSNTKDAVIGLLNASLKERDERVAILRNITKDNDATILKLRNTLDGRDTRVLELLTLVVELHNSLDTKDTIIKDNDATILELRKTLEGRDTIYETNLKTALAVKDTINADLCKAIEEQRDAINHLRKVAVGNYVNVKRVRP